jgi:hypothetical protein
MTRTSQGIAGWLPLQALLLAVAAMVLLGTHAVSAEEIVSTATGDSTRVTAAEPKPEVSSKHIRLNESDHNVVRTGPGDQFAIVGIYEKGSEFPVIAKSGDWYNIRVSETETGWIHASLCEEFDDLSGLEFRPNPKLYARTGSFAFTAYLGAYSFDRKSNSLTLGGRLGYYIFDRLQAEAGVGWKVLPGRRMVPYVTGGLGSTIMQGRSELTYNYGAGTTLFVSKQMAMRWEVRAFRFDSGTDASRRNNNNITFTLGTSLLF